MKRVATLATVFLAAACQTSAQDAYDPLDDYEQVQSDNVLGAPDAYAADTELQAVVDHGAYLVELMGCGACHTDGALIGEANADRALGGSTIGIAFSNPLKDPYPAIVYPSNLTPDPETGIGNWTEAQVIRAIQHGVGADGMQQLPVMPWSAYRKLKPDDVRAIARYLMSLEPVRHRVPDNVRRGQRTPADAKYVHFGVYMSRDAAGS